MSSSTALLPKDRNDGHPIFLRASHSPWRSIGQKALVGLRAAIAIYLAVSSFMILDYELRRQKHGWLTIFEFSNTTYIQQSMYHWITLIWTFMHLYYPHHASQTPSHATRLQKFLSPPQQSAKTKNGHIFSIFYNVAITFPHMTTFIHWAVLTPNHKTTIPTNTIFTTGWFTTFFVFTKFGVNSVIALIEVIFLSSIRRANPIWSHVGGISVSALIYVGWTFIGYIITDKYGFYFFDHAQVGWEYVIISIAAFVALANILFFVVYGITGIREALTKNNEEKSQGYSRLPE